MYFYKTEFFKKILTYTESHKQDEEIFTFFTSLVLCISKIDDFCESYDLVQIHRIIMLLIDYFSLYPQNQDGIKSSICTLGTLSDQFTPEIICEVINKNILSIFFDDHMHPSDLLNNLRIIGNLTLTQDENVALLLIKGNNLTWLKEHLSHNHIDARQRALWIFSNLAIFGAKMNEILEERGIIDIILELAKDLNPKISQEANWAICNIIDNCNFQLICRYIDKFLDFIVFVLKYSNTTCLVLALESLRKLLKEGTVYNQLGNFRNPIAIKFDERGGVDCLEKLQNHENSEIYEVAYDLLNTYFEVVPVN
jgi:hypothetical protein